MKKYKTAADLVQSLAVYVTEEDLELSRSAFLKIVAGRIHDDAREALRQEAERDELIMRRAGLRALRKGSRMEGR